MSAALAFRLPRALEAAEPPEARGLERDEVRLMVARGREALAHARLRDLPAFLRSGDLLVVNASATLPAALDARRADGTRVELHLSTPEPPASRQLGPDAPLIGPHREPKPPRACRARPDAPPIGPRGEPKPPPAGRAGSAAASIGPPADATRERWIVELRRHGARFRGARCGERLALPAGARVELVAPYLSAGRLWIAELELPIPLLAYLDAHGAPIRYSHQPRDWPLADHQTVFARVPGSAEMPSAGRPFTARVLAALAARGIAVAPLVLHTGVSSQERGERPYAERFSVPARTAARVNETHAAGGRVIAVGTTVARALETVAQPDGTVRAASGWTSLVITPERGVRAVDGLITGWHEPDASHLLLLEAVAGRSLVERSYDEAIAAGYRWHEFGDSHLLLP